MKNWTGIFWKLVMIALYCEMKPSREEGKTLIFFQDAVCLCTKECFPISSVSFLPFEVLRRERWCSYCLPIFQTFEKLFMTNRDNPNLQMECISKVHFWLFSVPFVLISHRNKILLDDLIARQAYRKSFHPWYTEIYYITVKCQSCAEPWRPTNKFP